MDQALDRLACRQHGLLTAAQLRQMGYDKNATHRLLLSGRIVLLRKGVYRLCGVRTTWFSTAMAAVLAAGPEAVLSHRSAGVLWGLLDRHANQGPLDITRPTQCRAEAIRGHRALLLPGEATTRNAIPVTTVERTLLDLAESEPFETVGRMIDAALRRELTTMSRIERVWRRHAGRGRGGTQLLGQALRDRGAGHDPGSNDWEQGMDRMWDRMGLPPAERQYRIRVEGGRSYKPDRAIVDVRMAVDWNGYGPHGTRSGFDDDSDRRARLSAAGWFPLDFTSRSDPRLICRTVMAVYRQRLQMYGFNRSATPTSLPPS